MESKQTSPCVNSADMQPTFCEVSNGDLWLCVRHGLTKPKENTTLHMCTVKIESGLGYKSSQVRVQVQVQQSQVQVQVISVISVQVQVQVQQKWTKFWTRVQVRIRILQVCLSDVELRNFRPVTFPVHKLRKWAPLWGLAEPDTLGQKVM